MGSGASTTRGGAPGTARYSGSKGRPIGIDPTTPQATYSRHRYVTTPPQQRAARVTRGARSGQDTVDQPRVENKTVYKVPNETEYPDTPPRRVYTFTEETDNKNRGNVVDNRTKKAEYLVTYNRNHQPESVQDSQEEHRQFQSGNTKFEGHTTQSSFVQSKTTVTHGDGSAPVTQRDPNSLLANNIQKLQANVDKHGNNNIVSHDIQQSAGGTSARLTQSSAGVAAKRSHSTGTRYTSNVRSAPDVSGRDGSKDKNAHLVNGRGANRSSSIEERTSRQRGRTRTKVKERESRSDSRVSRKSQDSVAFRSHTSGVSDSTGPYDNMPRSARKAAKPAVRTLAECKVRFLGRYLTQELCSDSIDKLRAHIRMVPGVKTKLKLTNQAIRSGSKYSTLFKTKVPVEVVPLGQVYDVYVDDQYLNLLLVVTALPGGSYDILAYRTDTDHDGRMFEHEYARLRADMQAGDMMHVYNERDIGNWTLSRSTGNYANANMKKANSMNDILFRNTLRSRDATDWASPTNERRARSRSRDRFTAQSRDRSIDRMSSVSAESLRMKQEIEELTRQVQELRSLVDERNRQGDGSSSKGQDDEVFNQMTSERPSAMQVDRNYGTVKVKVGDYRPKITPDIPTIMVNGQDSPDLSQTDGPIRLVYNGNSFDSSDSGVHRGRTLSRDPSTSTNASGQRIYRGTARHRVAHHRDSAGSGVFATVQRRRASPGPSSRTVSQSSSDYPTLMRARSSDRMGGPISDNVYIIQGGTGPPSHGSRAARARQGATYITGPDNNPFVATAIQPQRNYSDSNYINRVHYYWALLRDVRNCILFIPLPSSASSVNILSPSLVVTVPADVPAPNGARSSADSVLTTKIYVCSGCSGFLYWLLYPPHNEVVGGYIGFTQSVCPSVRPSRVRPASCVRSVASTVLVGSISYSCIL